MSGFDLPPVCWAAGLVFLVFAALVAGAGRRDDRRWSRAIDGHHARTGRFPTLAEVTRPVRRPSSPVTPAHLPPAEVGAEEPVWWLLDCPPCALSVYVAGTAVEIDAAVDWHNRTHHGTSPQTGTTTRGQRWAA